MAGHPYLRGVETAAVAEDGSGEHFRCHMTFVTYAGIAPVRHDIEKFLAHRGVSPAYTGMVLLTVSEILTNLVKHPPRKAERVEISLSLKGSSISLDVADDSTPFALFDAKCNAAFSRIDASLGLAESGYGLGCIMQQHARITYTPAPQSADGMNHFHVEDIARIPLASAEAIPLRWRRIFLVDDDPVSLGIHQRMLENIYDVRPFEHARDAIAAFGQDRPDMVISDLSMPDIDGLALRRALSAQKGGDTIPFIFLSGHRSSAYSDYVNATGIDDFLCKPITKERLLAVTARLMHRSAQFTNAVQGQFHQQLNSMLHPDLPQAFQGWRLRTLSVSAEAGGGDFTLHHVTSHQMLAVLADVMGHGQQAKFFAYAFAGYLRSLFRLLAGQSDCARFPERVSQEVNSDPFLDTTVMTCLAFQLARGGDIRLASAGHPQPYLLRRPRQAGLREIERLEVAGPLPGLIGESRYVQKKLRLQKGERIVMATDGFLQVFTLPASSGDGQDSDLAQCLRRYGNGTLDDMAGSLWTEFHIRNEASALARDDATLIIIEYTEDP